VDLDQGLGLDADRGAEAVALGRGDVGLAATLVLARAHITAVVVDRFVLRRRGVAAFGRRSEQLLETCSVGLQLGRGGGLAGGGGLGQGGLRERGEGGAR
jgi:hypothetical protein